MGFHCICSPCLCLPFCISPFCHSRQGITSYPLHVHMLAGAPSIIYIEVPRKFHAKKVLSKSNTIVRKKEQLQLQKQATSQHGETEPSQVEV